ncbi:hypothetical protein ANN_17699 [Periplaneta americana]|uniref:CAAX prenyl protease 2 n=1 Tax=Periplaneta americana TaxID=6978 RepID=A0ABQ8SUN3_PERAM|nr:hypothetical protein ANN_17699 [Periplaneta americana]
MVGLCEGGNEPLGSLKANEADSRYVLRFQATSVLKNLHDNEFREQESPEKEEPMYWMSNLTNLIWLRNHVVAPLSEEFTFRACMLPLLLQCFRPMTAVFVCPLFFGVARSKGGSLIMNKDKLRINDKVHDLEYCEKNYDKPEFWTEIKQSQVNQGTIKQGFNEREDMTDEPREFNLPTLQQRRITYVLERLPSNYGVHSEEYLPIRMIQEELSSDEQVSTLRQVEIWVSEADFVRDIPLFVVNV